MSSFMISVGLDERSIRYLSLFRGGVSSFQATYEGFLEQAGWDSLKALHMSAEHHMWTTFMNPTGPLEDSLDQEMETPYRGWMGSELEYARRRNWGFVGMYDSLGRGPYSDEGIEWAEYAIDDMTPEITGYYQRAVNSALATMGGFFAGP